LTRVPYEEAYPEIRLSPRSRSWWARLKGTAAECAHLENSPDWMATLLPDVVYLLGQSERRRAALRPEILLCRDCLLDTVTPEMAAFKGRVVAFEPGLNFSQYFFVSSPDFGPAGLTIELDEAIAKRMPQADAVCVTCDRPATWLWFSREQVASLDDMGSISNEKGELLCAAHGAKKLRRAFENIGEANVKFMNLPYGESGAYVWI
jgi:hypothetical protein